MEENYRFSHRLKVRYSEIDSQNIVFNSHYLTYLDVAVTEYFEEGLKLNYEELAGAGVFDFVLAKSTLEFKGPATAGDWLTIWARTKSVGRSSFTLAFKITREDDLILLGEIVYVSIDSKNKKAKPVPDFIREKLETFEGQSF